MNELYRNCTLCPRTCGVDRLQGERGYCGESAQIRVAWAGLHLGEEPLIIGTNGSGTIFFSGCTLKCDHCQNRQLSKKGLGRELSSVQLAELMLCLQYRGAANINLVSASHFAPSIVESVAAARRQGLAIPVVWNCSGYERRSTLDLLKDTIDVYLPDCKTLDPELGRRIMAASDYPEIAERALLKMVEDKPLEIEHEQLRQGVIVRHLVLPGLLAQNRRVLEWFAERLNKRALLSLMFQYIPVNSGNGKQSPQRTVSRREYGLVLSWLEELKIEDGFVQEPAGRDEWLPDFKRLNPFPSGQALPVWHYESGLLKESGGA